MLMIGPLDHRTIGPLILQKNRLLDSIFCGGTIIGPSTILTAAHCMFDPIKHVNSIKVLVAEHDVNSVMETSRQ